MRNIWDIRTASTLFFTSGGHKKRTVATKVVLAATLVFGSLAAIVVSAPRVGAAACEVPSPDMGTVTLPVNVTTTATYTIWTRMKAPSASQNKVNLEIDGNNCISVGGGSLVAPAWSTNSSNWIRYRDGAPGSVITVSLNAGMHTLKYVGVQAGVEIDRIILTSDPSCTPSGVGANCQSGDSTAPTVSVQVLANGQQVTNNQTVGGQLTLNALASDASGIASVQFLVDGNVVSTDTTSPYSYNWTSSNAANGTHTIAARATDTKNNTATSSGVPVNVSNAAACSGAPSVPANFRVTATTSNSVSLAWGASTPAAGCALQGYRLYRDGSQVAAPAGAGYTDSGLTPGITYSYRVAAIDTAGHISAQSTAVSTVVTADTAAPSVPANLRATLRSGTSIGLAWNTSTDNTGVKEYVIYRNGTQAGVSATTAFTVGGLAPNTTYTFTVRARDLANNMSASSTGLAVSTTAATAANRGDLNGSGKVDLTDLSILLSNFGKSNVAISQGDTNGSGKVDLTDLSVLLSNFGKNI